MTESYSKVEIDARLETVDARADAKFERLLGEIRLSNANLAAKIDVVAAQAAGKWTVWAAALTVAGLLIAAVLVFGQAAQSGYDTGYTARSDVAVEKGT